MYYYICFYIISTYCYQVSITITYYYSNNGFITRSIIGTNGFIITYYWPGQLGDVEGCQRE